MRDHRLPALRTIALVVMAAWAGAVYAAGLGPIRVQSALGQPLRASVPVLGADVPEFTASCIKVRLENQDGALMAVVQADVARSGQVASIQLSTRQPVNEPAATLKLEVTCGSTIERSYPLLLDPVLLLPQLASPQAEPTGSGNGAVRNTHGEQAMFAQADGSVRALVQSRRGAARKATAARQQADNVTRNVLKLSRNDVVPDNGDVLALPLKLSDTLSESRDTGDAQRAAELQSAYARFALVLRGEDPTQHDEKQIRDMQAKLQTLEKESRRLMEQSERQHQADQATLASLRRDTVSSGWMVALGGLLLTALGAIGWLYLRLKGSGRGREAAFLDGNELDHAIEPGAWDNPLGVDEEFAGEPAENVVLSEAAPSEQARGVPLDNTLALDSIAANTPPPHELREGEASANVTVKKTVRQRMPGEEVSDLLQEAEFWMLLNAPERAIEILEPRVSVAHPVSPVPSIYLLDLYRVTGQRENYQTLAARIKTIFNTSAPTWSGAGDDAVTRSLRDYPHVVRAIEALWEEDGIVPYLEDLLLDERAGTRTGFDLAVYREIIHLIGVARDPETPRRREQLGFDQTQPRMISQTVGMSSLHPAERMADMARKLDLVLAYQEIGENVGARVLLEEVIQGGSPLQVEKARAMLKKLLKEIDWQ